MSDARRHAPATARNREPILAVLRRVLPREGLVLEVASGTGEHAMHFAAALPDLVWQPSDPSPDACASIAAWRAQSGLVNLREPLMLDAAAERWPIEQADAILCVNMVHISPWAATEGLMRGAGRIIPRGAPFLLYGPYREADVPLAPSNAAFDADLRARNPEWGLREVDRVALLAAEQGLMLQERVAMPANNLTLLFRRR